MKKMISVCLFVLCTGAAFAQSGKMDDKKMDKMDDKMKAEKMHDGIMMKDGKMMVVKGGMSMAMMSDTTVGKGTMVMKDGTVKMKDGSTHMLKDGEFVMPNGKVKMAKMDKMSGDKMSKDKMSKDKM